MFDPSLGCNISFLMASTTTKSVKLGELLQEQQEPFVLEVYLFERGCLRKSLSSNSIDSSNSLKRSCSWGRNKSKKGIPSFSKILRSVYNKFVSKILRSVYNKFVSKILRSVYNKFGGSRIKSSEKEEGKSGADTEITLPRDCLGDSDGFSTSSSRTQYESCCDSDKDEAVATVSMKNEDQASLAVEGTSQVSNLCNMKEEKKVGTDSTAQWGTSKKKKNQSKQHSSISVLEDRPSHAGHGGLHIISFCLGITFPATIRETKRYFWSTRNARPVIRSNPSPHKPKRMLQRTRQLLFDCVREMTETHAKQMKGQNKTKFLGAEELGKLISEKLRIWDRQAGDETNIDFLLDLDFLSSAQEWNRNEQEEKPISCEIGDAILEDIIKEIVRSDVELDPASFSSSFQFV